MPAKNGELIEVDERPALRFERVLPHSPERVWKALTDPDEMAAWHPTPARFEARAGGRVDFLDTGYEVFDVPGEVLAYEPPTLLSYTWGQEPGETPDRLRFELRPHDDGCLLTLVHSFDDRLKAARDGAGWHLCLDSLEGALDGAPQPPSESDDPGTWEELNSEYQERYGILPEEATPPPSRR
jgi:uncharacterized protein YndB with AHSA1/START domain